MQHFDSLLSSGCTIGDFRLIISVNCENFISFSVIVIWNATKWHKSREELDLSGLKKTCHCHEQQRRTFQLRFGSCLLISALCHVLLTAFVLPNQHFLLTHFVLFSHLQYLQLILLKLVLIHEVNRRRHTMGLSHTSDICKQSGAIHICYAALALRLCFQENPLLHLYIQICLNESLLAHVTHTYVQHPCL